MPLLGIQSKKGDALALCSPDWKMQCRALRCFFSRVGTGEEDAPERISSNKCARLARLFTLFGISIYRDITPFRLPRFPVPGFRAS